MVAFALTPVTILLVVVETLTYLAIDRTFGVRADGVTNTRIYEFQMGYYPWSHRSRTALNSHGFPDDEFNNLAPKGSCKHVVFAGDSFVFGDGVNRRDNFVSLVREWSGRRKASDCLRFFNLGERATTIQQQAQNIERMWDLLQPNVVILGQYQNDLTDLTKKGFAGHVAEEQGGAERNWRPPMIGISSLRYLTYHTIAAMSQAGIRHDVLSRWSVLADDQNQVLATRLKAQYAALFDGLVQRVRQRSAEFGVFIMPSKFDVLAGRAPEEEFFATIARQHDVPMLALFELFDRERRPYPFLLYDGHLNTHGNYLVASALTTWLFDTIPAPFAALQLREPEARRAPSESMYLAPIAGTKLAD
jgi:hypothetical protein